MFEGDYMHSVTERHPYRDDCVHSSKGTCTPRIDLCSPCYLSIYHITESYL